MTDTTELELQSSDLCDAALLEMAEQEELIESLRQQLSGAQAHLRALEGEAKRLTRSLMALKGLSDMSDHRVWDFIQKRRVALREGKHIDEHVDERAT